MDAKETVKAHLIEATVSIEKAYNNNAGETPPLGKLQQNTLRKAYDWIVDLIEDLEENE